MSDASNMFEVATRKKLRFDTKLGKRSVEDLWDLPLTHHSGMSLDEIAKAVSRELKGSEESFVSDVRSTREARLELQMSILKHIIAYKLEAKARQESLAAKASEKAKLLEIIKEKEDEGLRSESVEELRKRVNAL